FRISTMMSGLPRETSRMSVEEEPEKFSRCEWCGIPTIFRPASVILSCGHVICEECRSEYVVTAKQADKIPCRICGRVSDCFMLPSREAATASPTILNVSSPEPMCRLHDESLKYTCTCREMICLSCTESTHAHHFKYTEVFSTNDLLVKAMERLTRSSGMLVEESAEISIKKRLIIHRTAVASNEIAAKCSLIIAQAINRCLHVQSQLEAVKTRQCQEIDTRVSLITKTLEKIQKVSDMVSRSKSSDNLAVRLCMQKAAFAMSEPLHAECQRMRVGVSRQVASLSVSYSANFESVMDCIATLGERITVNSLFARGTPQQFLTFTTERVKETMEMLQHGINFNYYALFQKAVTLYQRRSTIDQYGLSAIGITVAPLIVVPEVIVPLTADRTCSKDREDAAACAAS
ncbi:hypothetical protein PFISCL1PPCAC_21523, partial [Pristionchus fissidentatus]